MPSYLSTLCLVHVPREPGSRCRPQLRELVPCHCTASGKALLAWRDSWREAVLEQPLRSFTDRTLTGPDWLRRELAHSRARGFAVEDREFQADTRGVAVPIFGGDEAVAALGVVAPAERLPPDRQREIAEIAGRAAGQLSTRLVA